MRKKSASVAFKKNLEKSEEIHAQQQNGSVIS